MLHSDTAADRYKAETSVDVDDFDFEVFQAAMAKVPSQKYDGELMPYKE